MKSTVLLEIAIRTMERNTKILYDAIHQKEAFEQMYYGTKWRKQKIEQFTEQVDYLTKLNRTLHKFIQKKINK